MKKTNKQIVFLGLLSLSIVLVAFGFAMPANASICTSTNPADGDCSSVSLTVLANGQSHSSSGYGSITVTRGDSITLSWTSSGVGFCNTGVTMSPYGPNITMATSGSTTITPTTNFTWALQCSIDNAHNMIIEDGIHITVTDPVNAACTTNAQCGTNGFTGSAFCAANGVYQNYTTYTCNNPGTANAFCSSSSTQQLQTTCASNQTCSNGTCQTQNTGACSTNAQCGTNGLSGAPYCSGNGVYQIYNTYTCNNPGTANSYCSNSTTPQLQQQCASQQVCSNGTCTGQNQSNLVISCNASPNPAQTGQPVNFTAQATGGTGSYTYYWSGSCNGFSQTCSNIFSQPNTYIAFLTVTSGNQTMSTSCSAGVTQAPTVCTQNASQRCVGNSIYWFDSCGNQQSVSQICSNNQTCSNATCVTNNTTTPSVDIKINGQDGTVTLPAGSLATLTWTSTGVQRCNTGTSAMTGNGWGNYIELSTSGSHQFTVTSSGTFGIQCSQTPTSNMSIQDSVAVVAGATPPPVSVCSTNAQCGSNGIIGAPFCSANGVYQNFISYTCNNPGSANSFCSSSISQQLVNNCTSNQTCSSGVCQNQNITCSTNAQCGTNGLTGTPFCSANGVYQNYRTYTCNNPGTAYSSCSSSDAQQLQTTCTSNQTCSNGACVANIPNLVASCTATPASAQTNQPVTFTATATGGTGTYSYSWSGSCNGFSQSCSKTFTQPSNYIAFLTVTSGNQTTSTACATTVAQTCTPHTTQSCVSGSVHWFDSCGVDQGISQACTGNQVCSNAQCVTPACTTNADCGTNGVTGSNFCNGNAIYQNYKTYTCNNPGTLAASCSQNVTQQLVNNCSSNQTCSNATCSNVNIACNSASDCGTNGIIGTSFCSGNAVYNNYRTYTCNNAGTANSSCSSTVTQQVSTTCTSNQTCSNGTCNTNIPNLAVSCTASASSINTNQNVTFTATATGGSGAYSYSWTGACNGYSQNCSNSYSNSGSQTAFVSVTSGNQTVSASCSATINQSCTPNASQRCVGNSVYWFDSCGNQQSVSQICSNNQTCSNNACVNINNNYCTQNASQRCVGNSVYWFDSCGNQQGISQVCGYNQTCSNNTCVNTQQQSNLTVTTTVRNLSAGNLNWSTSVAAHPSDIVQFNIAIQSYGNTSVNNVMVRDILPYNLTYNNGLTVDGVTNTGNILYGVNIGSISQGQTRNITYQAQVGPDQNFSFGSTTLTDGVTITSDQATNPNVSNASVLVTRSGVLGATSVSTGGLTGNFLFDSFLLPLILALLALWAYSSGLLNSFGLVEWVGVKKAKHKDAIAKKQLFSKIQEIKDRENKF